MRIPITLKTIPMRFWNTLFLVACLPSLGLGQVVINEFSCSNYTLGIGGDNEDFVEFYNPSGANVDLGGYFLSDNPAKPDKFEIPAGTEVPAGGYLMVMCYPEQKFSCFTARLSTFSFNMGSG